MEQNVTLSENVLKIISIYIKNSLSRIIPAPIDVVYAVNEKKGFITFKTSEFSTIPRLFKTVYVIGDATIVPVAEGEKENKIAYTEVYVTFSYRFESFNGGYNGTPLGSMKFDVFHREFMSNVRVDEELKLSSQSVIYDDDIDE